MTPAPERAAHAAPLLLGSLVGALVASRIETALACTAVAGAAAAWAGARGLGVPWRRTLFAGVLITLALNLLLVRGRPLPVALPFGWHATYEGLRIGVLLSLRLVAATLAVLGLRAAWPGERAADELARMAAPLERLRVPIPELRAMIALALRFAPLLADEARRIARLQEHRAGGPARGLAARLERRRAAAVPTLVAALERAERVAFALDARHYRVRPLPARTRPGPPEALARALGLALAGTALLWRHTR
jgi:energy-coupling factor transporter transmembrane protein EcfT